MKALTFHGRRDVRVDEVPDPKIEQPTDAVVRITSTAICGSDLHLYEVLGMFIEEGDVLGHEPMGIVEEVGSEVSQIKAGDRVVIPFNISCGECWMCKEKLFAQCETTQNREQEKGASLFGYTKLYGEVPGGQAEYLRVPQAHFGPIKVPENGAPDERYLFLSDVLPTAWQAAEYAAIPKGGSVAVYGLGPIGQMCARIARHKGADTVIGVDSVPERLEMARRHGVEAIDSSRHEDVPEIIREMTDGRGPDGVIDAVGMEAHGAHVAELAQKATGLLPRCARCQGDRKGVGRPPLCPARGNRHRPAWRNDLDLRRLRRPARSAADDAALRQGRADPHGPGSRTALDRRDPAPARRRRGPARSRRSHHPSVAAGRGAERL
jgi:threonine dehydrogenase-like Zn-dependent dehydrogenase